MFFFRLPLSWFWFYLLASQLSLSLSIMVCCVLIRVSLHFFLFCFVPTLSLCVFILLCFCTPASQLCTRLNSCVLLFRFSNPNPLSLVGMRGLSCGPWQCSFSREFKHFWSCDYPLMLPLIHEIDWIKARENKNLDGSAFTLVTIYHLLFWPHMILMSVWCKSTFENKRKFWLLYTHQLLCH